MNDEHAALDGLQRAYRSAVDSWIGAIRAEAALVSVNHTVAAVDQWEGACFRAEEARHRAVAAKQAYEAALRAAFFGIA